MNFSFEYGLCLGLVGLYLFDSAKLISYNQLFLVCGLRSQFSSDLPPKHHQILKKYVYFTRPLHGASLVFLMQWKLQKYVLTTTSATLKYDLETIKNIQKNLRKLQISSGLVWLLTLIIFPFLFIIQQNSIFVLILLMCIYTINLIHILLIYLQRNTLQITKIQCLHYLIDALFCPPFALNLLKKICLNYKIKSDAITLAIQLLSKNEFQHFAIQLISEIEQLKISETDIYSSHFIHLQQLQDHLKKQIGMCTLSS